MLRSLLLAMSILFLIPHPAESADNPSELLSQREQFLRSARVNGDNVVINHDAASLQCWAYFSAIQDLITITFDQRPPYTGALRVCAPPNSTLYEQIRVFVNYAQQNPTVLSRKTGHAVMAAMMSAYPCNGQ